MMQINTSCYMFGISTCPETCFQNMHLTNHGSPKKCVNTISITRVPQNSFRGKVYYYQYGEKLLGGYAPQQLFPIMVIIYFPLKEFWGRLLPSQLLVNGVYSSTLQGSECVLLFKPTCMFLFIILHWAASGTCIVHAHVFQWLFFYKTRMLKNCRRSKFFRFYTSAILARRPPPPTTTGPQD